MVKKPLPKTQLHAKPSKITVDPRISDDPLVKLSFQYLDLHDTPEFCLIGRDDQYFISVLERFRDVNKQTINEFRAPGRALRVHPIVWDKTSKPNGFSFLPAQLTEGIIPYQFQLSQANGRFHGFFIAETFYIVWFDPNHQLYPM